MKNKSKIAIFFACIFILIVSVYSYGQINKEDLIMNILFRHLEAAHYSPIELNDEFSEKTFETIVKRTDFGKRFLLKSDVEKLSKYKLKIDDQCKDGRVDFFDLLFKTIKSRTEQAEKFYEAILSEASDLTTLDSIETDGDKLEFVESVSELKERWRKNLQFNILKKVSEQLKTEEELLGRKDTSIVKKDLRSHEEEARKDVLKSQKIWFKRMKELDREDRLAVYINSLLAMFGPHTNYMPPKNKEDFDIHISGRLEGIGAQLQQKDEYIKVVSIVPGSASQRQGELEAGDVIIKVAQADSEAVDVVDMRLDKAVHLIRGPKGTEVRLTVKKIDGIIKIIPIIRDVVILEATYAKSLILQNGKRKGKMGYLRLPTFYADFSKAGGQSCAADVHTEIIKLKKEKIEGLILDLRDNGGGALSEAVTMTGLFIKDGPIVQVKHKNKQAQILRDEDPDVAYDGPLVVMVNDGSASASEILAAAIQDYGRGVIVGASTFGKGTVQRIFDLDVYLSGRFKDYGPLGALKVTMQKFYRVNGRTTQLKGVEPDILLPHIYDSLDLGEGEQDYAMPWDEISKARYSVSEKKLDLDKLRSKSKNRVDKNESFSIIKKAANRLKEEKDKSKYSLNLKAYRNYLLSKEDERKEIEKADSTIQNFSASNLKEDLSHINSDSSRIELNKSWLERLQKDNHLYESINILLDLEEL